MTMQLGLMTVAGWGGTGYYEFAARAAARAGPRRASAAVRSGLYYTTCGAEPLYSVQVQETSSFYKF